MEWRQVPLLVRATIKKVHGSRPRAPYKESLARYILHVAARRLAIDAARLFLCEQCERTQRPPSRPAAAIPQ